MYLIYNIYALFHLYYLSCISFIDELCINYNILYSGMANNTHIPHICAQIELADAIYHHHLKVYSNESEENTNGEANDHQIYMYIHKGAIDRRLQYHDHTVESVRKYRNLDPSFCKVSPIYRQFLTGM